MRSLIVNKPDDPVRFLIDRLEKPESKCYPSLLLLSNTNGGFVFFLQLTESFSSVPPAASARRSPSVSLPTSQRRAKTSSASPLET